MWTADVPIFEDEDEDELISEFVRLSVLFPNRTPQEITRYIFKDLPEPELRSGQAAMQWAKDIAILDRIEKAKRAPKEDEGPLTKAQLQAKLLSVTEDSNLDAREKKVMIEGYTAYAANEGWVIKAVDKKLTEVRRARVPIINQGIYPDA